MHCRLRYVVPAFLALLATGSAANGQARLVTGRVTIAPAGTPLPDAIVAISGQAASVRTNEQGEFRILVPSGDVELSARAIGYKRVIHRVPASGSSADFVMQRDILELEGIVITGAATTIDRRNAATAVALVNAAALARVPAPSVESALQGKVIGASINMNNGAPGGGGQIQIRGPSSLIGRIEPLIVIDGVALSNARRSNMQRVVTASLNEGEENGTNRLADINPNDIETIEVLKSAAASAIYGSQATNGVIVITTKRGASGPPRFNLTQRVGTYQLIRKRGSRRFRNLEHALEAIGSNEEGIAAAEAACTLTSCPYFDYQGQLFGSTSPSYQSLLSVSGGPGRLRYYISASDNQEKGIARGTGARRQSVRANIDQQIGPRLNLSLGSTLLRSFSQRGISNNDNAAASPLFAFSSAPALIDLRQRDEFGRYVLNPFSSGGSMTTSNPFQTFDLLQNNEDVYRLVFSGSAEWAAYRGRIGSLTFRLRGGADRYSSENYIYAPQELQFQRQGTPLGTTFPGVVIQGNGTERLSTMSASGVWTFAPSSSLSATSSLGTQVQDRVLNDYNIIGRGLGPQQVVAQGARDIQITDRIEKSRIQAAYAQQELLLLDEKLYLSGAIRGERASLNGDTDKIHYYPRGSASYRLSFPRVGLDEVKLRASYGVSGNEPRFDSRFITLVSRGIIGGQSAYGLPRFRGNPAVRPERLNETELGIDAVFLRERIRFEATRYNRRLSDLLVAAQLAPSSGVTATVVNGGEMETKGYELGLTLVPVRGNRVTWASRATWYQNRADVTRFPVGIQAFTTGAGGGFDNAYGTVRFTTGHPVTTIWGNRVVDGVTLTNQPLADANPRYLMSFGNDVTLGALSMNVLLDYRRGGTVTNMTLLYFDEGANTWDYDNPSPDPVVGKTLGEYRYNSWAGGANTSAYLADGSYAKLREVNVSYQMPAPLASRLAGAQSVRLSLSGRNLFVISGYNGFDPEVSDPGNVLVRFIDLFPFPPSRSFFFSVELGY